MRKEVIIFVKIYNVQIQMKLLLLFLKVDIMTQKKNSDLKLFQKKKIITLSHLKLGFNWKFSHQELL